MVLGARPSTAGGGLELEFPALRPEHEHRREELQRDDLQESEELHSPLGDPPFTPGPAGRHGALRKFSTAGHTMSGRSRYGKCAARGTFNSVATPFGIEVTHSSIRSIGIVSSSPCTTSSGMRSDASAGRRSQSPNDAV